MKADLTKANENRLLKASSTIVVIGALCLGLVASPLSVGYAEALMVIYLSFAPFFGAAFAVSSVIVWALRYYAESGRTSAKTVALAVPLILIYSAWFYGINQLN